MKSGKRNIILLLSLVFGLFGLNAQETIKKEVKVIKPYEPTLSAASKISLLPELNDTVKLSPDYQYTISPKNFQPVYKFRPLKPARMESESISKLYHSFLKMSFGNYISPAGELHINNLRSKNSSGGAYIKHLSSYGKVKLSNDEKVFSGFGDTDFLLYGKKLFKNSILKGEFGANHDWVHFYGYKPSIDTSLSKENIRQNYLDVFAGIHFQSSHLDSNHLNYDVFTSYHFFNDRYKNTQHEVDFQMDINKSISGKVFGGKFSVTYLGSEMDAIAHPVSYIGIEPWFSQRSGAWALNLALNMSFEVEEGNVTPHFYPKAKFKFNVVPRYLTSYLGVDGSLESHSYREISNENPFQMPGLNVKSTDHKLNFFGGFHGSFSRKSSWHLRASYSLIDQMYFFVNDTVSGLGNQFHFEYDDVELGRVQGEISAAVGPSTELQVKANYYFYGLARELYAWHKPNFDITAGIHYNLRNKILVDLDAFYIGKRYAKSYDFGVPSVSLDGFMDLNLKVEYRYTRILSAWLRLNNILGRRYEIWNQYPGQSFFIQAGFTYSL